MDSRIIDKYCYMTNAMVEDNGSTVTVWPLGGDDFTIPSAEFESFCREQLEIMAASLERQGDTETATAISNTLSAVKLMKAIKRLANNPEAADNFESYLSAHFAGWINKWVTTPAGMAEEFTTFAEMF